MRKPLWQCYLYAIFFVIKRAKYYVIHPADGSRAPLRRRMPAAIVTFL
jgi:hypothetical protein